MYRQTFADEPFAAVKQPLGKVSRISCAGRLWQLLNFCRWQTRLPCDRWWLAAKPELRNGRV